MNSVPVVTLDSSDDELIAEDDQEICEVKVEPSKNVEEIVTLDDSSNDEDDDEEVNDWDLIDVNDTRTKLFVNYLPQNLSDNDLMKLFIDMGPIKDCWIFRDRTTNYSYGYGVVDYEFPEDANKALRLKNKMSCQGKELLVIYSRDNRAVGAKIFFKNAGEEITEEGLKPHFEPFGNIIFLKLLYENNVQTGNGFIQYENRFQAAFAIKKLNGNVTVDGSDQPLIVGFAEEHGKQKSKIFAAMKSNRKRKFNQRFG